MIRFFLGVPTSLHLADRFDQPVDQSSRRCAARIAFHGVRLGLAHDSFKPVPQERSGHFKEALVAVDRDAGALHELARIEGQRLDVFEALVEGLLAAPRRAPGLEKLRVADWRLVGGGDAVRTNVSAGSEYIPERDEVYRCQPRLKHLEQADPAGGSEYVGNCGEF